MTESELRLKSDSIFRYAFGDRRRGGVSGRRQRRLAPNTVYWTGPCELTMNAPAMTTADSSPYFDRSLINESR